MTLDSKESGTKLTAERIDIKDSVLAIQTYVGLIKRRVKDPEVLRMGSRLLLRMEQLKRQVGECYHD